MVRAATIIGGALLVIGIAGLGTGLANGRLVSTNGAVSYDETKTVASAGVKRIGVSLDAGHLNVTQGTSADIKVHVYGNVPGTNRNRDVSFDTTQTGGDLQVTVRHPWNSHFFFQLPFHFSTDELTVDVEVPKAVFEELSAKVNAGKLTVSDAEANHADLQIDAGMASVTDVTASLSVKSNAGAVEIRNVVGDMDLKTDAGKISVDEAEITHDITAKSSAGAVYVTTEKTPTNLSFRLKTDVGRATVDLPNATTSVDDRTDVEGTIGNGGPRIDLSSNVGAVSLEKP